MKEEFILFLLK